MKVSLALHTEDPGEDGNQRSFEARYMNYNRLIVDGEIDAKGNLLIELQNVAFVASGEAMPDWCPQNFRYISAGVCTGPLDSGGSVIIRHKFDQEMSVRNVGDFPTIKHLFIGVLAERLKLMMDDGRLFTLGDVWPPEAPA